MFTGTAASSDSYSIYDYPQIGRRPPTVEATKWWCTNIEVAPNCPRCASTNTKFCYYNNYSLSQPRYFCKACRRYWTKGGSLRNVPVGGGCRKSRRARSSRTGPNPAHNPASGPDAPPESGPCIDMAAVFAKYVSPSMEGEDPSFSPRPSSGSSDNYSQIEDGAILECHRDQVAAVDGLIDSGDTEKVPGQFFPGHDMDGGDFSCQGFGPIGMQQGVIGDDVAPDVLWSSEVTGSPDFGAEVQPEMPVPDFGLFPGDDPFRISGNLMAENWAPFDLSAYELFSNP